MMIKKELFITICIVLIVSVGANIGLSILYIQNKNDYRELKNNIITLENDINDEKELSEQNDDKVEDNQEDSSKKETTSKKTTTTKKSTTTTMSKSNDSSKATTTSTITTTKLAEKNSLVGKWQYIDGDDISTYEFKNDGTLWIDGEYIDNYTDKTAICDNCLTHIGTSEIQFMIKDEYLYINFYKKTLKNDTNNDGVKEETVYWCIKLGSYVKASRIS